MQRVEWRASNEDYYNKARIDLERPSALHLPFLTSNSPFCMSNVEKTSQSSSGAGSAESANHQNTSEA